MQVNFLKLAKFIVLTNIEAKSDKFLIHNSQCSGITF